MDHMRKVLDEFLDLMNLPIEEKRVIEILFREGRILTAREIGSIYRDEYGVKIGNKIYFVLNNLLDKDLVTPTTKEGTKYFSYNAAQIRTTVQQYVRKEFNKKLRSYKRLADLIGQPPIVKYSGIPGVINGFLEMEENLLKGGGTMLDVRDILPFIADSLENLKLRHKHLAEKGYFSDIEKDCYRLSRRHELLKNGSLEMKMVLDRQQATETLERWIEKYGKPYTSARLAKFLELLELPNFQVIFSREIVDFMVEVIPGHAAALYWRSEPRGQTDRLIVFRHPSIIVGLEDYFWNEYDLALKGKGEKEAKERTIEWAENMIKVIEKGLVISTSE